MRSIPGILFVDAPVIHLLAIIPTDYSGLSQSILRMRNWYTLPLTLYCFLISNIVLTAQQISEIQWSPENRRHLLNISAGATDIHLCGLSPGGSYSVIANPVNKNQQAGFAWSLSQAVTYQQDIQLPQRIFIRADSTCMALTLDMVADEISGTIPVYISIRRTDETKPPAWLEAIASQAEFANLSTTGNVPANNLISNVLIGGNCFDVSNVTTAGNATSRGTFANGGTSIGINNGMVLCTGNVNILPGPNNSGAAYGGYTMVPTFDADLGTLTGGSQFDLSKIEFNFRPTSPVVSFDFVFGSEEYCEFVDAGFNDVFGFFISGPGIAGNQNIALIPSTATPVSIDNVSDVTNTGFFVGNSLTCGAPPANNAECQLDGWTAVFTATANVIPCQTYHIKLAIADVGDDDYASAVFLRANSFDAGGIVNAQAVYPAAGQFVLEGCGQGFIRFQRAGSDLSQPVDVNFTLSGSATPGVDYEPLSGSYTIPAGQSSILIPVNVFSDLIAEGTETIVLLLDNPCSCTQTQVTFNIQDMMPMEVFLNDVNGCGSASAVLSPFTTGGQAPLTYVWSTGATTPAIGVTTPGTNTYTVTVTDACGRTSTDDATVTLAPSPTANLSGSGAFCEGSSNPVDLTLTLGGPGDWTVTWLANGTPNTGTFSSSPVVIAANQAGTYSLVSVVSQNGCTGTVSGIVNIQQVNVNLNLTPTAPTCFGSNNGSISAVPSGGTGPYTYAWSPAGSGANPNNLPPGTYTATVTSSQGCTEVASVTLTEPPELTATANTSGTINCYTPNNSIDLSVNGGTPNYNYNWSNGSTTQDPTVTTGGTYTVTVRDARNCTTTATVSITANVAQPTAVIATPAQLNCNTSTLTLNAGASSQGTDFQYQWSGPGIICCSNTLNPQINQGGVYSLTVTNTLNGCTRVATVNIQNNNSPPAVNASAPFNIGCNHPTVALSGAGSATGTGITYQWTTTNGNIQSGATSLSPVVNQAGTYTLVVTNNNTGCTAEESVTISGDTQLPTAVIAPPGIVDCFNPIVQLNGTGSSQGPPGFTYNWTGSPVVGGGNTLTPNVSAGGTYTLIVTNPTNNCTASATVTVMASLAQPNAQATVPNGINCQNATVTINGAGSSTGPAFSYQWTTSNGNIISGNNTLNPIVNQGGTYTLIVTNNTNGCTRQVSVNVTQDQSVPQANAGSDRLLNCLTQSIQLTGSGTTGPGYSFAWSASPGAFASGQNTLTPTVNQPGTYTLLVTNTNTGCTSSDVVVITSNFSQPVAQISVPGVLTCEFPTLQLDGSNSTSGSMITYNWTAIAGGQIIGSNINPTVTAGSAGAYRLLVTNQESGCTAQAQVIISQNINPPLAEAGPAGSFTCQNPTVTLSGAGSSVGPNFSYQWSTTDGNIFSGATTLNPVIDMPGIYVIVVTNTTNGCTALDFVPITTDQNLPTAHAGPDLTRTCTMTMLTLDGGLSSPGMQYQWVANPGTILSGANTRNPVVNQAGVYTLSVTNVSTGCTDTDVVVVTNNIVNPVPLILPPAQLSCNAPMIGLDATGSTMTGTPVYNWTTANGFIVSGNNTATPQVNVPGIYQLTLTNSANACSVTAQVTVNQDVTLPDAVAVANDLLTCQNTQVQLDGQGSSEGSPYQYQWSSTDGYIVSGDQTLNPMVGLAGNYTLTVLSTANGCSNTASVLVQSSQEFPVANAGPPQTLTCDVVQLSLNASESSLGSDFAYLWNTTDGNIVSGGATLQPAINAPGTYNLSIINQSNGCTATASVVVGTNYTAPAATVAPGGILSCSVASLSLNGAGSSAGNPFTYNWLTQNGNIVSGINTLQPVINAVGAYTLVVTNTDNGCTSSASTTVQADAGLPVANAGAPDTLNCAVNSVVINASTSSQGSQYSYSWAGPGDIAGATGLQPLVEEPGEYFLTVTNTSNGCTAISAVVIVRDVSLPLAEAGPVDELTCTKALIALDGSASSAGSLFQYMWVASNGGQIVSGAGTPSPTINEPGTYLLLITNTFNNCTSSDSVTISRDIALPVVEAGPPSTLTCVIPSITLQGQGSTDTLFAYNWTTQDGNIASGDSSLNPVVDAPGTYLVVVTNTYNGCTATDDVLIFRDANVPDAVAEVTGELNCVTGSLQLSGLNSSQGATILYSWETTTGHIVSGDTTLTPVVDEPGQYTLEVFNTANSCVALSTVIINENLTAPVAQAGNPAILSCANPVITLDGSTSSIGNQYLYQWNTQNGNILLGDTSLQPQVDQSGFYTLIVTDQSNGCTAESTVQILLDQNTPEADAGASPTLTCTVTNLLLDGSDSSLGAQFSYQWSTQDGQIIDGETTLTPAIGAPGTYTLLVTNVDNGCISDAEVLVNQDIAPPLAAAGHELTLTCTVLATNLHVTGSSTGTGFSYQWSTQDGQILTGANTPAPSVGEPGTYQLQVLNLATGCTNTATVLVPEDVELPGSASAVSGELTCSVQTLPLSNAGSSTGTQYAYLWTSTDGNIISGTTDSNPVVNESGMYNLLVTNTINGCTSTSAVEVLQNITPPVVDATVINLLTCTVTQIQLQGNATGGSQGVSYAWTGPGIVSGGNTPDPNVNSIGQYTLTATDLYNGCTASDAVVVSNDVAPPLVLIATPAQLNCYVTQTNLSGAGSSTGGQFIYTWTGSGIVSGANTLTPAVNQPGAYNLLITNTSNGCVSSLATTVAQDLQAPVAQAGGVFELTCSVTQGALNNIGSTTGNGINYVWSTANGHIVSGGNSPTPVVDEPGLYALTVINAQTGCTNTASVSVTENTNYPSSLNLSRVLPACGGQAGEVVIEAVNGGVGPYLYSIDGGDNFVTANAFGGLAPGTYSMVVQDINGCEYQQNLIFPVPVEPQVSLTPEIKLIFGQDAKLTATLNIPLNQVDTIIWEPMETLTPTSKINEVIARPFKDTEYTVRIINIDGCESVARVLVRVEDPQIWAPNIFSPHRRDGNSDYFLIFAAERTVNKIRTLQIYDRWGTMVFRRDDMLPNDETLGWDGRFRGKALNPAVFVWWAEVELADGQRILMKGDVTIAD